MNLTVAEKIRILLGRKEMNMTDLAAELKMSRQNLANKMRRNNFNEKEIKDIAEALKCGFEINFILENGDKI